jgi:hypothetical protein
VRVNDFFLLLSAGSDCSFIIDFRLVSKQMLSLVAGWSGISALVLGPFVVFHRVFALAATVRFNDLRWLRCISRLIWLLDLFLIVFHNVYMMVRGEKEQNHAANEMRFSRPLGFRKVSGTNFYDIRLTRRLSAARISNQLF